MKAQCVAPASQKVRRVFCPARGTLALRASALGKVPFFTIRHRLALKLSFLPLFWAKTTKPLGRDMFVPHDPIRLLSDWWNLYAYVKDSTKLVDTLGIYNVDGVRL